MIKKTFRSFFPKIVFQQGNAEDAYKAGYNATNNPINGIKIWSNISNVAGVLAQELYEWRRNFWRSLMFMHVPFTIGIGLAVPAVALPVFVGCGISLVAGLYLYKAHSLRRGMELLSHAIEIQVAVQYYGFTEEQYRTSEINSLKTYAWLDDMSDEEISKAVQAKYPEARKWIKNNKKLIEKAINFKI